MNYPFQSRFAWYYTVGCELILDSIISRKVKIVLNMYQRKKGLPFLSSQELYWNSLCGFLGILLATASIFQPRKPQLYREIQNWTRRDILLSNMYAPFWCKHCSLLQNACKEILDYGIGVEWFTHSPFSARNEYRLFPAQRTVAQQHYSLHWSFSLLCLGGGMKRVYYTWLAPLSSSPVGLRP